MDRGRFGLPRPFGILPGTEDKDDEDCHECSLGKIDEAIEQAEEELEEEESVKPPGIRDTPYIYHRTDEETAQEILSSGFETGYKRLWNELQDDSGALGELQRTMATEAVVDHFMPDNGFPVQRFGSTFFHPSINQAMNNTGMGKGRKILEVDHRKIPCKGYRGDVRMFGEVQKELGVEVADIFGGPPDSPTDNTVENPDEISQVGFQRIEEYWIGTHKFTGKKIEGTEIWYNCFIPSAAIVEVLDLNDLYE